MHVEVSNGLELLILVLFHMFFVLIIWCNHRYGIIYRDSIKSKAIDGIQ